MSCLPRHRGRQYVAIGLKRLMSSGGRKGGFVDLAAGLGLLFCLAQLQYCSALNPDIDLRRMFYLITSLLPLYHPVDSTDFFDPMHLLSWGLFDRLVDI